MNTVQEISSNTANLLTGLGIDEVFTRTDSSGTRHFLTDALGSTLALADGAGAVQTQYTYEPFGEVTVNGPSSTNPFQYTGRENDGTGLYYHRARYYQPGLQRFISEDPAGFIGGDTNLQTYTFDDPTGFRDSSGMNAFDDFSMGIVDSLTFTLTKRLPNNWRGDIDECSLAYRIGDKVPLVLGVGRLAYAATAKALPLVFSSGSSELARALQISSARNLLKRVGWAGLPGKAIERITGHSFLSEEQVLAKYGPDAAKIISKATSTNPYWNSGGGWWIGGSMVNRPGNCQCQ